MKRRVVMGRRRKTTKRIMGDSKSLVIWEYGLRHRRARIKVTMIIAEVLVVIWHGFHVME